MYVFFLQYRCIISIDISIEIFSPLPMKTELFVKNGLNLKEFVFRLMLYLMKIVVEKILKRRHTQMAKKSVTRGHLSSFGAEVTEVHGIEED